MICKGDCSCRGSLPDELGVAVSSHGRSATPSGLSRFASQAKLAAANARAVLSHAGDYAGVAVMGVLVALMVMA